MTNLKEKIDHIMEDYEWLDSRIREIFKRYCEIYNIKERYGIDSWEIGSKQLYITQDISCRGCYDVQNHSLPIECLYASNYGALIKRDYEKHLKQKEIEEKQKAIREVERLIEDIEKAKQHLAKLEQKKEDLI